MAKKPKIQTLHKAPYKFQFWLEGDELHCNVYRRSAVQQPAVPTQYSAEPCLEWTFDKIPGNNLIGNAAVYLDQAWLYAENPPDAKVRATSVVPVHFEAEDLVAMKNISLDEARIKLEKMADGLVEYLHQMGADYLSEHFDDED